MSRIRNACTGGAALEPDVFRFYHAIGGNLKQIYGQTEISGVSGIHRNADINFETIGYPIPDTEIEISDEGEVLSKSPCMSQGYYGDPEATSEALRDRWLCSGDAGYVGEDGHLVVIDWMKDVMKFSNGSIFSPQYIENKLKFSPYVREIVVVGTERGFVTAIKTSRTWRSELKTNRSLIPHIQTLYINLCQKPEVYALMRKDVEKTNEQLPEAARIQ